MRAALFVCCCIAVTAQHLDHRFFLVQIIEKYGNNGSITYEGFDRLYKNLGLGDTIGNPAHKHDFLREHRPLESVEPADEIPGENLLRKIREMNEEFDKDSSEEQLASLVDEHEEVTMAAPSNRVPEAPKCMGSAQILAIYGIPRSSKSLSPVSFLHLCPAIIYQLDQGSCSLVGHQSKAATLEEGSFVASHSSWVFALLAILVISVSGLLCVAIVPLLQKTFISQLISFLVALAVGTLLGDAFLHLIPHALQSHGHNEHESHTDSVLKTGLIFLTVVFFFTFEEVLNLKRKRKDGSKKDGNSSYVSVDANDPQTKKEMMQMSGSPRSAKPAVNAECHVHVHSNTAVMVVMGDGLHNLTDGLAIGAAFSGGLAPGFATAVAVFTHELPHELGDFAVLLQTGMTVRKALLYNTVSSVLSLLGTIVGLLVGNFGDATRWIYAITAGSFIYIALSNLVPEMNKQKSSIRTIFLRVVGILCGGAIMGSIAIFEHDLENLFS